MHKLHKIKIIYMHPEIEKLIELSMVDGQISEKEKAVIIKKGIELGVDQDEIEITIDALIFKQQTKSSKEKVGNIKTCPACGSAVKTMTMACEDCGHEFNNVGANKSISELLNRINTLKKGAQEEDYDFEKRKADQINNTPIPNSREDLLEFLTVCISQADVSWTSRGMGYVVSAWESKGSEALLKAKILFREDLKSMTLIEAYEKKLSSAKKKANYIWFIFIGIGLIYGIVWLVSKYG